MKTKVLEYINKLNLLLKLKNSNHYITFDDINTNIDFYRLFCNDYKIIIYDINFYIKYDFVFYKNNHNQFCLYLLFNKNYCNNIVNYNKQFEYLKSYDFKTNTIYNINYITLLKVINDILRIDNDI